MTYGEMWNETPTAGAPKEREMDEIPDGIYDGTVDDFSCFRAKSGEWYVSWWVAIDNGLQRGKLLQRFQPVTDRSAGYVKADLQMVTGRVPGWDGDLVVESQGQTGPVKSEIIGARVRVRQKSRQYQGKRYVDVYLNELLTPAVASRAPDVDPRGREPEEALPASRGGYVDTDDIPF